MRAIARLKRSRVDWTDARYYDCFGTGQLEGTTDDGFEITASVDYAYCNCTVGFQVRDSESDSSIVFFRAKGNGAHWSDSDGWQCASYQPDQPTFEKAVKCILDFCREVDAREGAKQRALEADAHNRFFR